MQRSSLPLSTLRTFLADEAKEVELEAAKHLLTMSQSQPSPESDSSSFDDDFQRQDEEYNKMVEEQEANEEDEDDDYWRSYYEQLY